MRLEADLGLCSWSSPILTRQLFRIKVAHP
jgi:hypothetical protein